MLLVILIEQFAHLPAEPAALPRGALAQPSASLGPTLSGMRFCF